MPLTLNATDGTYVNKEGEGIIAKTTAGIMAPFGDGSEAYTVSEVRGAVVVYSALSLFLGIRAGAKAQAAGQTKVYGFIPTGQAA